MRLLGLSDCFTKKETHFHWLQSGEEESHIFKISEGKILCCKWELSLDLLSPGSESYYQKLERGKNKELKKVHCAAVAEKRNSILHPGWLGRGDGVMAKQRNLPEKLSALIGMSSPSLKNTLNCPDLTGPFF